jgi:hypothetical protein
VAVFSGASTIAEFVTSIANGTSSAMAVDTVRNKVYVNGLTDKATSIDGATLATSPIDFELFGTQVKSIAVEESTGRLFHIPIGAFNPQTGAKYYFTQGPNSNFDEGRMAVDSTRQLAYYTAPGNGFQSAAIGVAAAQVTMEVAQNYQSLIGSANSAYGKLGAILADPGRNKAYAMDTQGNQLLVFGISRVNSTLAIERSPNPSSVGESVVVTARVTGNAPEGNVRFRLDGNMVQGCENLRLVGAAASCTLVGLAHGIRTIAVDYFGDTNNLPTSSTAPQTVNKVFQTISFGPMPIPSPVWMPGGVTVNLTASASSTLPLTFHVSNGSCTIIASTSNAVSLRFANAGDCIVSAIQAGDSTYVPANAEQIITVQRTTQTIPSLTIPPQPSNGTFHMPVLLASSGYAVSFDVDTPQVCAKTTLASSYAISLLDVPGQCTITLTSSGDQNYLPATPVTVSFDVFAAPPRPLPIVSISPSSAFPGETVYLNFGHTILQGALVRVGAVSATITNNSSGVIQFVVPANAPSGATQVVVERLGVVSAVPFFVNRSPDAPTISSAVAGAASAAIFFAPVGGPESLAPDAFRATCGGQSTVGTGSPLLVTGLGNGETYNCTVSAQNRFGFGAASAAVAVTPSALAPLVDLGAFSRKSHAGVTFDLELSPSQRHVEPRVSVGPSHQIVFRFNRPVDTFGTVSASAGIVTASATGYELVLEMTGMTDSATTTISVNGINGDAISRQVQVGFLVGDINGSGQVEGTDCAAIKSSSGQVASPRNFLRDITVSGLISGADMVVCKRRVNRSLP